MGLTNPWRNPGSVPDRTGERPANCRPEPEPAPDRARERNEDASAAGGGTDEGGEVVALPTAGEVTERYTTQALARVRDLGGRWWAEGRQSAAAALDGSVYRARPAALRDIHARIMRAAWAGDIRVLRVAGQIYGHLALAGVAALYAAAWMIARPLRLAMFTLALLLTVLLM